MNDSINLSNIINETETNGVSVSNHHVWLYVVLIIIIVGVAWGILSYFKSERYKQKKILLKKEESTDYNNLINNAFLSKQIYDELKGKCHPDIFATNPVLYEKATEIMSLVVSNKHNYSELCKLKERAVQELNIVF